MGQPTYACIVILLTFLLCESILPCWIRLKCTKEDTIYMVIQTYIKTYIDQVTYYVDR